MVDWVIVDTDILIDISRKIEQAIAYIEQLESKHDIAISQITQMELLVGCRNKHNLAVLDKF